MGEIKTVDIMGKTYSYLVTQSNSLSTTANGEFCTSTAYFAKVNLSEDTLRELRGNWYVLGCLGLDLHDNGEVKILQEGCTSIIVLHYSTSQSHMNMKLLYMNNSNEILDIVTMNEIQHGYSLQKVLHNIDLIEKGNCLELLKNPVIAEQLTDYYSIEVFNNIYNLKVGGHYLQPNTTLKVTNISKALSEAKGTIKSLDLYVLERLGVSELYVKLYNRIYTNYLVGEFTFLDRFGELVENWQVQFIQRKGYITRQEIDNIHTFKEEYIENSFNQYEKDYLEQLEVHKGVRDNYYQRLLKRYISDKDFVKAEEKEYLTNPVTLLMSLSFLEFLIEHGQVTVLKS